MIWTIFTIWEVLKRNTHQHAREDHLAMKMSNNYYLPPDTIFSLCFMSSSQTFSQSYATITCKPVGIDGCYCMELRCKHYWKQNGGFLQFLFLKNLKYETFFLCCDIKCEYSVLTALVCKNIYPVRNTYLKNDYAIQYGWNSIKNSSVANASSTHNVILERFKGYSVIWNYFFN